MATGAPSQFRLTGRHVLFALIGFFGVIIATNAVFLKFALESFPGEETDMSYYQGLKYNDVLADQARFEELGWRMVLVSAPTADTRGTIDIRLVTDNGDPIFDAVLSGQITRPTTGREAASLTFEPIGGAVYRSEMVSLAQGAWDLDLEARDQESAAVQLSAKARVVIE